MKLFLTIYFILAIGLVAAAQNSSPAAAPLPDFTVTAINPNKVIISWRNGLPKLTQLLVQRSADSLRFFRTLFNAESPELPENGFTDNNTIGARWYYKISYVTEGGQYFTTKSKSAGQQLKEAVISPRLQLSDSVKLNPTYLFSNDGQITIRNEDSIIAKFTNAGFQKFRDSILYRTNDTLFAVYADDYLLKSYRAQEQFRQSLYLFVNRNNFVELKLPDTRNYVYRLIIFDPATNQPLMDLKELKEEELYIDKSNFIHAGSYYFELYRNGKIFEKNRLYLRKDF